MPGTFDGGVNEMNKDRKPPFPTSDGWSIMRHILIASVYATHILIVHVDTIGLLNGDPFLLFVSPTVKYLEEAFQNDNLMPL